jgi:hypothetical protein
VFRREVGLDLIALLSIGGAIALGEYLTGAVIALMLASGCSLEDFAEERARREMSALRNLPHLGGGGMSAGFRPDAIRPATRSGYARAWRARSRSRPSTGREIALPPFVCPTPPSAINRGLGALPSADHGQNKIFPMHDAGQLDPYDVQHHQR